MSPETRAVFLSPVWSDSRRGFFSLMWDLMRDGVRESPSLLALVIRDYWQDGLARVWRSARRYLSLHRPVSDLRSHAVIVGSEDPLTDWVFLEKTADRVMRLRGAHAFLYSHATGLAEAIVRELERS